MDFKVQFAKCLHFLLGYVGKEDHAFIKVLSFAELLWIVPSITYDPGPD